MGLLSLDNWFDIKIFLTYLFCSIIFKLVTCDRLVFSSVKYQNKFN